MARKPAPVLMDKLNEGGLADSKWSGIRNSFYKLTGWDMHTVPGTVKVAQKMVKDSGVIVSELCRSAVSSSNGAQYWFSYTSGKVWELTSGGTWRLVHTTTPSTGGTGCLGAKEYQGYVYWATEDFLHRIAVADADDNDWATDAVEEWATFDVADTEFHPMEEQNLVLYIGDGNQVAQVDEGVFSSNALDVKTPLRVKSLGKYSTDLLVGTYIADGVNKSTLFRWNTYAVSFTSEDEIPEVGINCFFQGDNIVYAQCGKAGNIYVYNGRSLELYRKIPGDYTPSKHGEVYPEASANLNGQMLFGFSNGAGNPADQGVYRIAKHGYNYPFITDFPYPISERDTGALVTSGVEIGAILVVGSDLYTSWSYNSGYGVDKLDYSNKLELASMETRVFNIGRYMEQVFPRFSVAYATLPSSTALNIFYSKNYAAYVSASVIDDTNRKLVYTDQGVNSTVMQVKVTATVNSNNAPEIESLEFALPSIM